jgi:hypothetical protein
MLITQPDLILERERERISERKGVREREGKRGRERE